MSWMSQSSTCIFTLPVVDLRAGKSCAARAGLALGDPLESHGPGGSTLGDRRLLRDARTREELVPDPRPDHRDGSARSTDGRGPSWKPTWSRRCASCGGSPTISGPAYLRAAPPLSSK